MLSIGRVICKGSLSRVTSYIAIPSPDIASYSSACSSVDIRCKLAASLHSGFERRVVLRNAWLSAQISREISRSSSVSRLSCLPKSSGQGFSGILRNSVVRPFVSYSTSNSNSLNSSDSEMGSATSKNAAGNSGSNNRSPQKPHFFSFLYKVVLGFLASIYEVPTKLITLAKNEKATVAKVEDDVDITAQTVDKVAKAVEQAATTVEKVAEVVAEDARKTEAFMEKTEAAVKKVEEAVNENIDNKGAASSLQTTATSAHDKTKSKGQPKTGEVAAVEPTSKKLPSGTM